MTHQRILELADMYSRRAALRRTIVQAVCIIIGGVLGSWALTAAIEWASRVLVGR